MNVKLKSEQCPYRDTVERRNDEKEFEDAVFGGGYSVFFSGHVLLFCGRCPGRKGRTYGVYVVSGWFVCSDAGVLLRLPALHFLSPKKT